MDYILDTNFLIGLWRKPENGPEADFLSSHLDAVLALPWIAKGEFLRGAVLAGHQPEKVRGFLSSFPVLWPSEITLSHYATLFAALRRRRQNIGPNDLWIAATAVERSLPILTRNAAEFIRVTEIQIIDYTRM